ncbi:MAG: ribosomal RNA small subunit methyltransferase A [Verrucomicrobia bacterium]|nr:MAG: ribosomal RNA small subunit methyltransferase A [Verrucomicrobiota bacterium]
MTLSEMKRVLASRDIRLTKSLGQNFLHDANQLRRIADAADLGPQDKVLEIGPGLGSLTSLLLTQAGEVVAIEKDARLVKALRENAMTPSKRETGGTPVLHLVHADALEYLRENSRDWRGWKMVSNLPYSVASRILVELAQSPRGPALVVATLQIEVAQRLMAAPGSPDYGLLTLLVQLDYEPFATFKIPASCFFPEPDVDSACVSLARRPEPLLAEGERLIFTMIVKRAFSQRRKMMLKLLKQDWPVEMLEKQFDRLGLSHQVRAEEVGLKQFVEFARGLV